MIRIRRETKETRVEVRVTRDGREAGPIDTGDAMLDHMLVTLARYSGLGLGVDARGDLKHHRIEDVAITLGLAVASATPAACARYGSALVPMDDALVEAALDLGGRPWYEGPLPSRLYDHFMRSFCDNARATLHLRVLRGRDRHHVVEAGFKAVGFALRSALRAGEEGVFSTKGNVVLDVEEES
jgi:imidazoleglycerol-phosphate dehydratase